MEEFEAPTDMFGVLMLFKNMRQYFEEELSILENDNSPASIAITKFVKTFLESVETLETDLISADVEEFIDQQ